MEKRICIRGQMLEAASTGIFLILSGGSQDTYTYYCRGGVFANVQTGNIVLMRSHLASREWGMAFRYMAPVAAFACGVYMAEYIRRRRKHNRQFHWRQMAVAIEIILLFLVGFMSQSIDMTANIAVSFVYAMQVNAFHKVKGSPYTTTVHIGNLRNGMEHFYAYRHTRNPENRDQCIRYYGVIVIFLVGVVLRVVLTARLAEKTMWVSCGPFLVSFLTMFLQEDTGGCERAQ